MTRKTQTGDWKRPCSLLVTVTLILITAKCYGHEQNRAILQDMKENKQPQKIHSDYSERLLSAIIFSMSGLYEEQN